MHFSVLDFGLAHYGSQPLILLHHCQIQEVHEPNLTGHRLANHCLVACMMKYMYVVHDGVGCDYTVKPPDYNF